MSREETPQSNVRSKWISSIAKGTGTEIPPQSVPVYGDFKPTPQMIQYARLPPKYCLYTKLEMEAFKFDITLCNTKLRW